LNYLRLIGGLILGGLSGAAFAQETVGELLAAGAAEVHSFAYVQPRRINEAVRVLENNSIVAVSQNDAAQLVGRPMVVSAGESLYLLRGIDVSDPIPLRLYQAENRVEVSAGTRSTCFLFRPGVHRQPVVAALSRAPERLYLTYSCDG
jgi:hypothetical protein